MCHHWKKKKKKYYFERQNLPTAFLRGGAYLRDDVAVRAPRLVDVSVAGVRRLLAPVAAHPLEVQRLRLLVVCAGEGNAHDQTRHQVAAQADRCANLPPGGSTGRPVCRLATRRQHQLII